ncbi:MAG: hypothetical protein JWM33_3157, partial [Caulobacteraceae bacterium]|nr:hypothetical protein [Caulobacteraceae bacterium]
MRSAAFAALAISLGAMSAEAQPAAP